MIKIMISDYPMRYAEETGGHVLLHDNKFGLLLRSSGIGDVAVSGCGAQVLAAELFFDGPTTHISIPVPPSARGEGLGKAQYRVHTINYVVRALAGSLHQRTNNTDDLVVAPIVEHGALPYKWENLEWRFPIGGNSLSLTQVLLLGNSAVVTAHDETSLHIRMHPGVKVHAHGSKRLTMVGGATSANITSDRKATNAALRPYREGQARGKALLGCGFGRGDAVATAKQEWSDRRIPETLAGRASDDALYCYGVATFDMASPGAAGLGNGVHTAHQRMAIVAGWRSSDALDIMCKRRILSDEGGVFEQLYE